MSGDGEAVSASEATGAATSGAAHAGDEQPPPLTQSVKLDDAVLGAIGATVDQAVRSARINTLLEAEHEHDKARLELARRAAFGGFLLVTAALVLVGYCVAVSDADAITWPRSVFFASAVVFGLAMLKLAERLSYEQETIIEIEEARARTRGRLRNKSADPQERGLVLRLLEGIITLVERETSRR